MASTAVINQILGILTVTGQLIILGIILDFFIGRKYLIKFFGPKAIVFGFIIVLMAMFGSLFYSEIAGYEPCKLCWFQRILMYPQVLLLGMALWKKDENIADYILALSSVGAVIAGYHYLLQLGVAPALPCSAVGYSVSCSQRFVMQFGYITIPMMALTVFLLIGSLMLVKKYYARSN